MGERDSVQIDNRLGSILVVSPIQPTGHYMLSALPPAALGLLDNNMTDLNSPRAQG